MKIFKLLVLLTIAIVLVACGKDESQSNASSKSEEKVPDIPKNLFSSKKSGENIKENEMKKSINTYLNTYSDLERMRLTLETKDNISTNENKKLNKVIKKMDKNEENFQNYINENTLPKSYEKASKDIYNYTASSNELLTEVYDQTAITDDDNKSDKEKAEASDKLIKLNKKYKNKVNGKEQDKIEKFLDEKNISTRAFD